jgi:PPOX class probable F420-dependent enzyme
MIPESARAMIESGKLAHLVTLGRDGSPHVTAAWVGVRDDEVVIATMFDQRKLQDLRQDPRVTISLESDNLNAMGLTEYLVIYGTARITEGGAPELLQELAETYIGPGVKFPAMPEPPPGFVTRIRVDRLGGVGPWAPNPFGRAD